MRRVRAAIVTLALSVMSLAFAAGPASAGGPTSVTLEQPDTGKAASLYYTQADYVLLSELVGGDHGTGFSGKVDSSGTGHQFGSGVTLTWLIHDAAVWRVDRVYLDAEGGPWIATQSIMSEPGSVYDKPTVWHTVTDAGALRGLFERVGLGTGSASGVGGNSAPATGSGDVTVPQAGVPSATAVTPGAASRSADRSTPGTGELLWGLTGLVLGVALALAAVRVLPRTGLATVGGTPAQPAEDEAIPAHSAGTRVTDDEQSWTLPDELSWAGDRNVARRG